MNDIDVLLVEDNQGDVLLIKVALGETGTPMQINVVNDGDEAMLFLENKGRFANAPKPDIILLDINLPKKNGHEVLEFIKSNSVLKHIPVVILTTSSSQIDIDMAYANHANCYITKEADIDQFLKSISVVFSLWTSIGRLPSKK